MSCSIRGLISTNYCFSCGETKLMSLPLFPTRLYDKVHSGSKGDYSVAAETEAFCSPGRVSSPRIMLAYTEQSWTAQGISLRQQKINSWIG
ncbi:hypothetical protein RRG08_066934 [Elysia crispata]|uniref:Uncharacterized protein n=1 Tax=Elysia crispata TaxID=231223 RepID=A0AAE1AP24_9GAST|nr:hypothetical protein RRG08_066934 [Elysia crispata]